jgi:beta-lactamase class A
VHTTIAARTVLATLATAALLLSACGFVASGALPARAAAQATTAPAPTATPPAPAPTASATPAPSRERLAADVQIAGVDVSGLKPAEAAQRLAAALAYLFTPRSLRAGSVITSVEPAAIGFVVHYDAMIAEAQAAGTGARVPLRASYDEAALTARLRALAGEVDRPPAFSVITSTVPMSRSFALRPGARLDIDGAAARLGEQLRSGAHDTLELTLLPDAGAGRPDDAQIQEQLAQVAAEWRGVAGVYLYDLDRDAAAAQVNPGSVFSGASVMKVPIMLNAYASIPAFTRQQNTWLRQMIEVSDNSAANQLLAASIGASSLANAYKGAEKMTAMLRALGLEHTYQYSPYQTTDWAKQRRPAVRNGPAREGDPPFTAADLRLRTTPAEMARVFVLIHQCSQGQGALLELYAQQLSPARCQEMIDRLRRNADRTRMVAGLPSGADVAHKSGWISDMQADVGIVQSPGGRFVAAIYVFYKPGTRNVTSAPNAIARISRLLYSAYNPLPQHAAAP